MSIGAAQERRFGAPQGLKIVFCTCGAIAVLCWEPGSQGMAECSLSSSPDARSWRLAVEVRLGYLVKGVGAVQVVWAVSGAESETWGLANLLNSCSVDTQ